MRLNPFANPGRHCAERFVSMPQIAHTLRRLSRHPYHQAQRKAGGFRNAQNFTTAIYFHCGGLDLYPR
jgi:hypothetical protein